MPLRHPRTAPWLVVSGVALVAVIFLLASGVGAISAVALTVVVGVQTAAGSYAWGLVRGSAPPVVEAIGMGLAIGTALSVLSSLAIRTLGLGGWGWFLPALVLLMVWSTRRVRGRVPSTRAGKQATALAAGTLPALALTAGLGLLSLYVNLLNYPLTWTGLWGRYHGDMLFFEALGTSLARLGPLDSIFMSDALVRYHWLVYAWAGNLSQAVAADPFVVLTRALPFTTILAAAFLAIAWTQRLTRVPWAPSLAVVLLIMGGYVGANYGTILNFDSPSQALSTVWLLALSLAVIVGLARAASERSPTGSTIAHATLIALLAFCVAGGKISSGAVALAALALLAAVAVLRREAWWRVAVLDLLAAFVGVVTAYVLIVSGSADPGGLKLLQLLDRASSVQGLNPISGSTGIVLGTIILLVAISVRWAGLVWLVVDRTSRWEPDTVLGVGFALAGLGTVVLISGGLNDTWFALAASAPLSILSAAGVARACEVTGAAGEGFWPRRPVWWAGLSAIGLAVVVGLLWTSGASGGNVWTGTVRWLGPLVGVGGAVVAGWVVSRDRLLVGTSRLRWLAMTVLVLALLSAPGRALGAGTGDVGRQPGLSEEAFSPQVTFTDALDTVDVREWGPEHVAAATWLRENARADDLVATNITFSPFVPALTGLQTYVSGIRYQAPYGTPANVATLLEREAATLAFISDPTTGTAAPLCSAGVTWLWVDPTRTERREWRPFATAAFETPTALVLRLDDAGC